jgi:hypothetical protein
MGLSAGVINDYADRLSLSSKIRIQSGSSTPATRTAIAVVAINAMAIALLVEIDTRQRLADLRLPWKIIHVTSRPRSALSE